MSKAKPEVFDLLAALDEFQKIQEMLRGFVAALVADGFTDAEARQIVAHVITQKPPTE